MATMKGQQQMSPETRAKIRMLEMGITMRELAKKIGYHLAYTQRLVSGHVVSKSGRAKIEKVLGPIWTETPMNRTDNLVPQREKDRRTPIVVFISPPIKVAPE